MKKSSSPHLSQEINRQAHILAQQSFAIIRMKLDDKAREMLRQGRSIEETLRAIRLSGVGHADGEN